MQFTSTGNDVLTSWRNPCLDARIGLRQTLKTFDELGKICGVLDFDGDLDNRGDGEFS